MQENVPLLQGLTQLQKCKGLTPGQLLLPVGSLQAAIPRGCCSLALCSTSWWQDSSNAPSHWGLPALPTSPSRPSASPSRPPQPRVASAEERCLLSPFLPPSLAGTGIKSKVYEKMEGPEEILIWSQAD